MDKYHLTAEEKQLLKKRTAVVNQAAQLSGRPTTNLRDFFKRLFARKVTIIAILIFLGLILTAIIISETSPFGPEGTLKMYVFDDNGNYVYDDNGNLLTTTPKNFLISLLPPTWKANGDVELIISRADYQILKDLEASGLTISDTLDIYGPDLIKVVFNPYGFFNNSKFFADSGNVDFILGTNVAGQDNWTRVWAGTLESLKLALLVATAETAIGVFIGAYIGFHAGSKLDTYLMRLVDTISGVPQLIWFILISYMLEPGFWSLFGSLTAVGWIAPLYQTRMYVLRTKNLDFIRAAQTVGVPKYKLIYKYGLPQSLGRILSQFVRRIPIVIAAQASLAFLGFSNADDFNLGAIINDAKSRLENIWYLLTPTFIIFGITLSLQLVSNGINEALEPKVRV